MSDFDTARDALARAIRRIFPKAKPVKRWGDAEAWAAPRPEGAISPEAPGTYDPDSIVIGIADRKSGPVVYFLDPGDYFALETHRALLEGAGLKVGRGCIYHTKKGPLPIAALETLFEIVRDRDARAKGVKKATTPRAAPKKTAKKSTKKPAKKPARAAKKAR